MATNRRRFLKTASAGLLAVPFGGALSSSCASVPVATVDARASDLVALGHFPSASLSAPEDAIQNVLDAVDMAWLTPGDSVFVKLACNSGNVHPATTSPVAVRAMVRALFDRGAGRVLVGDQSGVMQVRLRKDDDGVDRRFSSTRALLGSSGLLAAIEESGAEVHCFDERGFDDGYVEATLPAGSPWTRPVRIARVVTEVDHIVYLPRISAHILTGYTHGHKIAVGFMRDDTRHDMHHESDRIYEKFTDVNYCDEIAARFRLAVSYAEEILLEGGPDVGKIATCDPRVVVASTHLANHDAVTAAILTWAQRAALPEARHTGGAPFGPWASLVNAGFLNAVEPSTGMPWTSGASGITAAYEAHAFDQGVVGDRALRRAYELQGGAPSSIGVALVGDAPAETLRAHLLEKTALALA